LIESASETPRIAAEIMSKLREEMNENIERDNSLLDERRALMMQLSGLSESLQVSALGQREAVESILANSSGLLADISQRFGDSVEKQSSKLSDIVVHFEGGSAELASLGDAFASAVSEFSDANGGLIATLLKVEAGLQGSGERSDEQMAYYVAQAREIIDHNMLSHQEIITQLQTLSSHAAVAQEDVPA
jgi:predicted phage tail protein